MIGAVLRIGFAMKRAAFERQRRRKHVNQLGRVPAPIRQRELAAEEQQTAAAAIDKLADEFLLVGSEVPGLNRTYDQALVNEQVFRARREAIGELFGIGDSLAINLVLASAIHGNDLHHAIVFFSLADELVFPARLTFYIEDAARFGADVHHAGQ